MSRPAASLLAAAVLLAAAGSALARSSDREQDMIIDAASTEGELTDNGTVTFSGDVRMDQGTLRVRADDAVGTLRDGEIVRVVLTGAPARLQQEDDQGQPMDARAARIDYDLATDTAVLTGDVEIEQPRGNLRGERVVYDIATGRVRAGQEGGRVRMVIQPKSGQDS
ncbi:lipopolysaccharide transport periplasmic protein LptA [Coralloluteibacterium stylophorae]|uniref:Lipopolysaccharide export system protein LptA n=1 Tax=Coralloluteibacterium stylophorae TaxID=1776034 RepID=A0A8J8AZE2_9GAMM|nr:lipopolysaccharide transport periplasmic protein LptA [Coralloluteibacterium stylophorae]MBS7456738.1 lipopolysaccharide transport periplasmic protein LptA [Coralloluteibacterium stylophorae]